MYFLHTRWQQSSSFPGELHSGVTSNLYNWLPPRLAFLGDFPKVLFPWCNREKLCLVTSTQVLFPRQTQISSRELTFHGDITQILFTGCVLYGSRVVHFLVTSTKMLFPICTLNSSREDLFLVTSTKLLFPGCTQYGSREMHLLVTFTI